MTLQDGTLPHLQLYIVGSSNLLIMTAVEFLEDKLSQILDWDLLELFKEAKKIEEQQLNKAWQEGAVTAQNDAAKEIEKNYVTRVR